MTLPRSLAANPRLSDWVRLAADGTFEIRVGKVELGQGILTALAQIAADELDVPLDRIRMVPPGTAEGPDEGITAGSLSVAESGAALRQACAEVRALRAAGATTWDRDADGVASPKSAAQLRVVGTSVPRLDLPDKVAGRPRYVHDLRLPGQLYGRVIRPPSPGARLVSVDTTLPGTVVDGSFLGVVAATEASVARAAEALASTARWAEADTLPDEDALASYLREGPLETSTVVDGRVGEAAHRATYTRPFIAHASIAPSCAVAQWDGGTVRVWSHTQGPHPLRRAIAQALGLPAERVEVRHVEGAGAYGHNAADDAAFDAVLLARTVPGRPVQVRWSRRDELTWAPFGSAMVADVAATVDGAGMVTGWSYDVWSQGHVSRPGYAGSPGLLAAAHLADPHPLPPPADPPLSRGPASLATRYPSMPFRSARSAPTARCAPRCGPRRCARSARSSTSSPSSPSWTSSPPRPAVTRSTSAWPTSPTRAPARCCSPPPSWAGGAAATAGWAWPATRSAARTARWSRRSRPSTTSGYAASPSPSTWAAWSTRTACATRSRAARCRPRAGRSRSG
ncbi:hypothetical protein Phou_103100 [Phytohabitans houttuyneae]|uniref:Aldehyde oxidase/xanthine dehydrogenase a/b hammerhead domain-containing protein n=1 Tax=Phytohabitans houttuyneae TaxID=1076126 RepID=A0A6V8KRT0_9ACTN|nr:hypothetical protein Phou_103100 [Phytohabitans houttuyneae]